MIFSLFFQVKPEVPINDLTNNCDKLNKKLKQIYSDVNENIFEIVKSDDLSFVMTNENITILQNQLDLVLKKRKKFICLNDDINYDNLTNSILVKKIINNFYSSFLPHPSPFELPKGEVNSILYIDSYFKQLEIRSKSKNDEEKRKNWLVKQILLCNLTCFTVYFIILTSVIFTILLIILAIFTKKVSE